MNQEHTGYSLIWIAIVVILVRCAVLLAYASPVDLFEPPQDRDRWLEVARNVLDGHGYSLSTYKLSDAPSPTALRGPTVVYFFAATLWLLGDHLSSLLIAQWLLDVGTAFILFFIALDIFGDRRVGLVAALCFACYVPSLLFSLQPWSEPLATFLLASFTWSLLRALSQPETWRFLICGILLGLMSLTKPVMQLYPIVILALLIWRFGWRWQTVASRFTVLIVAFVVVMSPWVMRNYLIFDAFISSANGGKTLYSSNYTLGNSDYMRLNSTQESSLALRHILESRFGPAPGHSDLWSYAKVKGINEYELDQIAMQEAKKVIRTFPGRYAALSSLRVLRFWFHHRFIESIIKGQLPLYPFLTAASSALLLGLSIIGLLFFRGAWLSSAAPLIGLLAYYTVMHSLIHAITRYNVTVMPYVILFASYAIIRLFSSEISITREKEKIQILDILLVK